MTDLNEEKLLLIDWIIKQDKLSSLEKVKKVISDHDNEARDSSKIVGQTPKGSRVSKKVLVERLARSIQELQSSELLSLDDLENQSEQW